MPSLLVGLLVCVMYTKDKKNNIIASSRLVKTEGNAYSGEVAS